MDSVIYAVLAIPLVPLSYLLFVAVFWMALPLFTAIPARKKLKDVPGPQGTFPFGNLPDIIKNPVHHMLNKWTKMYGKIYKLQLGPTVAVVLTDPDEISRLLRVEKWEKFLPGYTNLTMLTGETHENILTVPMGPYHKALRKAVTPAFSASNLKQFFATMVSLTERVMDHLRAQGEVVPVDMDVAAQRLTIDVIGTFGFDRNFGATDFAPNEALVAVQELLTALMYFHNPINRWFPITKEALELRARRWRFHAVVNRALDDLRSQPPAYHTLLHHLMNVTDPRTGKPLTAKQLRCETAFFWIAGFETTAHAIAWALMYIAGDAEVQSRVASELDSLGLLASPSRPEPRPLAWSDLGALKYLNAVIQEALRLMPPAATGTGRVAPCESTVAGYTIPRGTFVWVPQYALQRAQHVWGPDAAEFRPERWINNTGDAAANGHANGGGDEAAVPVEEVVVQAAATQAARGWTPFSEGPRNCVGQSLALLELRVALAMLCGQFRFCLADEVGGVEGAVANASMDITLKPGGQGLLMHVIPRVPA